MKQFIKFYILSFISIGARTASTLFLNKYFAVHFGPVGIIQLAQFQNLVSLVTTLSSDGINRALITYLAPLSVKEKSYQHYFMIGLGLHVGALLLSGLILMVSKPLVFATIPAEDILTYRFYILVGGFIGLQIFLQGLLLAKGYLRPYVWSQVIGSGMGILVLAIMPAEAAANCFLWYMLGQVSGLLVLLGTTIKKKLVPTIKGISISKPVIKGYLGFISTALVVLICSRVVDMYLRIWVPAQIGAYEAGLWQTAVKLSDNYSVVFSSVLGMVFYPKLAALQNLPPQQRTYIKNSFWVITGMLALVLLAIYFLRSYIITLLFTTTFEPTAAILGNQILGDFFKLPAWLLSQVWLVQAKLKFYVLLQVAGAFGYVLLTIGCVKTAGLSGTTLAHAFSYGALLLFCVLYFRKTLLP